MSEYAVPDPDKEVSFSSFVEQYEIKARETAMLTYQNEALWRMIAEAWAHEDIENIRCLALACPDKTLKEVVQMLLRPAT